jgi:amino acid transporter
MVSIQKLRRVLIGAPRDPMDPRTRQHIALVAFFAWIGLGADGLSSSCYGPQEAFLALGEHTDLALLLAVAVAATVFIIALAYNQVIELFPSGGGGYKVASTLIGPRTGMVTGAALIVDYVLTVAISVASGADALFSLLPLQWHDWAVPAEIVTILILTVLNLRGIKEAIAVLLPLFLGFVVVHAALIIYGVVVHTPQLPTLIPETLHASTALSQVSGWAFVISVLMASYAQGGGTYTGLEAVSNNVNTLAEPRVATGKWTMFYMANSLAFTAGGIILLYMLWNVAYAPGQTLNAVLFKSIIDHFNFGSPFANQTGLLIVLGLEASLLFVGANTGFLGGPAVLSNMAADSWVPRQFRQLSSRLVTQNGVIMMGVASLAVLWWSDGSVGLLIILYSINVFLAFSLSILGLVVYWWRNRRTRPEWWRRLLLSIVGLIITTTVLGVLVVQKFTIGGWVSILITGAVVGLCLLIRRHYDETQMQLLKIDELFTPHGAPENFVEPAPPDPRQPTAIFFVNQNRGVGMHALLWVQRLFPGHFKNCVFLSVGEVDAHAYGGQGALRTLNYKIENVLLGYKTFCHTHGLAATSRVAFGTDPIAELTRLAEEAHEEFPNSVFFASKLVFVHDNFFTRWLHNQTALTMQRQLHLRGIQMVVLPMKVT